MLKELEYLPYEDRLRKLGLFSFAKRRLCGNSTGTLEYLKGSTRKLERDSSSGTLDGTKSNRHKLKEGKLTLDIRSRFFTVRVVRHWHRFPREAVDAPSLQVLKARVEKVLSNLV